MIYTSRDLDDVATVINALKKGKIGPKSDDIDVDIDIDIDADKIGILGHSRGGHTAVAAAAEHPEISCIVTWSAVADYNARWSKEMICDWETEGVTKIKNGRTGQMMPVKKVVYEDALSNADRVIALKRITEVRIPSLFIHAEGDEAVPCQEAEKLYQNSPAEEKDLKLIPDTGHTFGGSHPFEEDEFPPPFAEVIKSTSRWFQCFLG